MNNTLAILYISEFPNITLLKKNNNNLFTVVAVKELNPNSFSSDFLEVLEIAKELHVVYPSNISLNPKETDTITNKFNTEDKVYNTVIYQKDLLSLFRFCKYYGVTTIKIFDFFQVMGSLLPDDLTLLLSDYQAGRHSCILYSNKKLLGLRSIADMQLKYVEPLCNNYNINNIVTSYNIELVEHLYQRFTNINTLNQDIQGFIVPSIGTLQCKPVQTWVFNNQNNTYTLEEVKTKTKAKSIPKFINKPKFKFNVKLPTFKLRTSNKMPELILSIAGLALSATLAISLVANKNLIDKVSYLTDKEAEFQVLLDNREETLAYFQRHVSALTNGQENPDYTLYKALSAVKPSGPLGGITIDRESIVILFYLKEENESNDLDAYLQELANTKLVANPVVKTTSTVTYSGVNLHQYVVMFDRV